MEEEKRRGIHPLLAVLIGILCLCIGVAGTLLVVGSVIGEEGTALLQARSYIRREFVGDYDQEEYHHAVLNTMVEALGDRWSYYLTPEEYEQVVKQRSNSYVGIGVTVDRESEQGIEILTVIPGSPAEEEGLRAGELILKVDGVAVTKDNREACIEAMRGEKGSKLTLEVRGEDGTARSVELTRREVHQVNAGWSMLEGDVGYVQILNFYSGTAELVKKGVDELIEDGARALVFDVRNDPGGYMNELVDLLDFLLPEGVIFSMQYENGREKVFTSDADCIDLPMAVLVNADSYSAAEFFAAELREMVGALVVGETTCGKGFSQQMFPLRDGSALNISTARYYTGEGKSLIGTGLTPDPELSLSDEAMGKFLRGELPFEEDTQLQAAVEALGLDR